MSCIHHTLRYLTSEKKTHYGIFPHLFITKKTHYGSLVQIVKCTCRQMNHSSGHNSNHPSPANQLSTLFAYQKKIINLILFLFTKSKLIHHSRNYSTTWNISKNNGASIRSNSHCQRMSYLIDLSPNKAYSIACCRVQSFLAPIYYASKVKIVSAII